MKLEGEVGEIVLTSRLVELWREQFTGAVRFENDGIIKIIYFKGGDVLSASTNDRADSIDEILLRAGKVTRDHVKQALAKRKESETLGDALLNLGFITRKELAWARRVQVIGVIRSIEGWSRGSYTVVADYLPKREEGTLFPLPQLIVEMIVTDQERSRFERALDGGSVRFAKTAQFDEEFSRLGLNDEANRIGAAIDGQRTASDVAVASGQDGFNTFKLLHALSVLGLLSRVDGPVVASAPANEFDSMDSIADAGAPSWDFDSPVELDGTDSLSLPPYDEDNAFEAPVASVAAPPASTPAVNPNDYWSTDDEPAIETTIPEPEPMPTWESARGASVAPVVSAAAPEPEVQWGFDEAQIEAARNASVPVSGDAVDYDHDEVPSRKGRAGLIAAVLVGLLVLGGAAYYGFLWWQARENSQVEVAAAPPASRPAPAPPVVAAPDTMPVTPVDATAGTASGATVTATATAATSTVAPVQVPEPVQVASPPAQVALSPVKPAATAAPRQVSSPSTVPADRSRYDATARQNSQNPAGKFAVQLVIVCEVSNLEKAIRDGGGKLWYVPISVKGRSCYRVFWGRYESRDDATRAISEVPARLRESKPVAVSIPRG